MQVQDFCGFTFNGVHSSELGIVRVSDGKRYKTTLIPSFEKSTVKIPGNDGTLAWDSFYNERTFEIQIAYDNLTEKNRRRLRQLFSAKTRGWLIFDEDPYKKYEVEIAEPPQLTELCFDEEIIFNPQLPMDYNKLYGQQDRPTYGRIYKGEGTINFICYAGYAQNVWTVIDEIPVDKWRNTNEWIGTSGLRWKKISKNLEAPQVEGNYYEPISQDWPVYYVYNPGDREADWTCQIASLHSNFITSSDSESHKIYLMLQYKSNDEEWTSSNHELVIDARIITEGLREGEYLHYDSRKHLLEAKSVGLNKSIKLLNKYIISGDFFTIPKGDSRLGVGFDQSYSSQGNLNPNRTFMKPPEPIFYYY